MIKPIQIILLTIVVFTIYSCNNSNTKNNNGNEETKTNISQQPSVQKKTVSYDSELTNIGRFISGMSIEPVSQLQSYAQTAIWEKYAENCNRNWDNYAFSVSDSIKLWIQTEIPEICDTLKTVFYPFSGPDFLNVNLYFPNADKYILFGMEAPGSIPRPEEIDTVNLANYLQGYSKAISSITKHSFFHTKNMEKQLNTDEMYGVVPILMLFMARCEKKIISIRSFEFVGNGEMKYIEGFPRYQGEEKFGKGVEIEFTDAKQEKKCKLIYFSANIADGALTINTPTREYLKTIDNECIAYIKSATYLMHKSYFSIIRNTVLEKASVILQDDSGIKYTYFNPDLWQIQLYGTYDKPIELFENHFEEDLYNAYQQENIKKLPFRRGYMKKSNQLLAIKKKNNNK